MRDERLREREHARFAKIRGVLALKNRIPELDDLLCDVMEGETRRPVIGTQIGLAHQAAPVDSQLVQDGLGQAIKIFVTHFHPIDKKRGRRFEWVIERDFGGNVMPLVAERDSICARQFQPFVRPIRKFSTEAAREHGW